MSAREFVIAVLFVVPKVEGNADLRGVVLANELSGPPMADVEVSAVAANPNITDANGKFRFAFPNRNPGDTIRLIVHKDGYVVVNDIQLELTLPSNPNERPAIILLCKESEREEWARRFYRLKIVSAIDETYNKKLEVAKNTNPSAVPKLEQQRDQAKEVAEQLIKVLATQKPDVASEFYRTATQLFLNGSVDDALLTLSTGEGSGKIAGYAPGKTITLADSNGERSYRLGEAVTFVTKSGKVLDKESVWTKIKVGIPVHVHYGKKGDNVVVDRVTLKED
jgi:hypothetical protein